MTDEPTVRKSGHPRTVVDYRTVGRCTRCGAWHQYTDQKRHQAEHDRVDELERRLNALSQSGFLFDDPDDEPPPF